MLISEGAQGDHEQVARSHLPEERERVISDLIERAFPNLGIVLLKDEEEFTHIASVVRYMDHGSYDSLLEDYPEKRRARP
jgi:hypothetical protein